MIWVAKNWREVTYVRDKKIFGWWTDKSFLNSNYNNKQTSQTKNHYNSPNTEPEQGAFGLTPAQIQA